MSTPLSTLESVLFVSSSPLTLVKIAKILKLKKPQVRELVKELSLKWNTKDSGVHLIENNETVQLMSAPENAEVVAQFVKDETTGELTRPALETLSIIAYRQPVTKPELEQIRGVNCSLILRNLLMRGLITEEEDAARLQTVYATSMDFVRLLGVSSVEDLPEYVALRSHRHITDVVDSV